jgi:hypothetical protein
MKAARIAWVLVAAIFVRPLYAMDLDRELREAALVGDVEAVAALLEQGAKPNSASKFGKSALMFAAE